MANDPNTELLRRAARELVPLLDRVAFVGGATVALYLTDAEAEDLRGTLDVDMVIDANMLGYQKAQSELRSLGFEHDITTTFRFTKGDLVVDLMPVDSKILGFSNEWYKDGIAKAKTVHLGGNIRVKVFDFPYFLASKLDAFNGRGKGDYYASKDMEDIIVTLGGRAKFVEELSKAVSDVRTYLQRELTKHYHVGEFRQAIRGHLSRGMDVEVRARSLESNLAAFLAGGYQA